VSIIVGRTQIAYVLAHYSSYMSQNKGVLKT